MFPISDPDLHSRRRPFVNVTLILVNALVFLYELTVGDRVVLFYTYGLIPEEIITGQELTRLMTSVGSLDITTPIPTWGTLVTSMFMHGDMVHFGSNMLYLWVFGDNVEDRMGHALYLAFYIAVGVAAAWTQIAIDPGSQVPVIGASGAIAGTLGAYLMFFPRSRIRTLLFYYFITVIRIPAVFLLGFWILLQFWGGLGTMGPSAQSGGVAYWAHIGGFAAGAAPIAVYRILRRRPVGQDRYGPQHRWCKRLETSPNKAKLCIGSSTYAGQGHGSGSLSKRRPWLGRHQATGRRRDRVGLVEPDLRGKP